MKWLVAGPVYADTFAENIASALREMGEEVRTLPEVGVLGPVGRLKALYVERRQALSPTYLTPTERWVLAQARAWRPDIFLAPTQQFREEVLLGLRKIGVRARVVWWADSPANMRRMGLATREWDLILFKDPDAVTKARGLGLPAALMHEAMNPLWHRPVAERSNDEVVFAGNWYGYRQLMVMELLRRGARVGLYGPKPPRWAHPEIRRAFSGRYITREEKSRVFGEGLACMNSTSPAEGNSLNCRAFEIAGAAGLQLVEDRPIIAECFEPGVEILVFSSMDGVMEHLERAARDPQGARRIRQAAARRAREHHTYGHRLRDLKALLGLDRSGA